MVSRTKRSTDKIARRIARYNTLELREVIRVHFVIFHKISSHFVVLLVGQVADDLHLELWLAVEQQLSGGHSVGLHQLHDEFHDVKFVEELKFDYNIGGFRKPTCIHVNFCQLTQVIGIDYFLQLEVLHIVKYNLRPYVLDLLLGLHLHLFSNLYFTLAD
jgi:hypothetical protein